MKKIAVFYAVLLGLISSHSLAQTQNEAELPEELSLTPKDSVVVSSWIVGLGWNFVNDAGERFDNIFSTNDRLNAVAFPSRATIGRYFKSGIGLEAIATYNQYKEGNIIDGAINPEDSDYFGFDARLSYDLNELFGHTGFFDPYLGIGLGYTDANNVGFGTYNGVVGFRTWFNDRWGLDFSSSGKWAIGDEGSNHVQHAAGVVYRWDIEKDLSMKGKEKLALIQELEAKEQRRLDSIAAAEKAEREALALAEEMARKKAEAEEAARLEAERKRKADILQAFKDLGYVYFDFNSSYLRDDSKVLLEKLSVLMKEYTFLTFVIHSHADSRGPDNYNLWLSERRAQRTVDYLEELGIAAERMTAKGFGEERLTNHCDDGVRCTSEEHRANRRSEFEVIGLD